ncbi:hypothetical protein FPOA_10669 [Fusarium poae]|uniref:Protein kinase domain-containing protein n=1 Tax=Fusarium poae TaxID=36050 RepID=A0A1B8AEQ1_FUSPO|nr:hypothetical protein FPOA_10669 [Fusarium poae]
MSHRRPRTKWSPSDFDIPSTGNRHIGAASYRDNEFSPNDALLTLPTNKKTHSQTVRSAFSFASIESVHDGGTFKHAALERQLAHDSVMSQRRHPTKRRNQQITIKSLTHAFWAEAELSADGADNKFLPLNKLKSLINPESVQDLLYSMSYSQDEVQSLIQDIFPTHLPLKCHAPKHGKDYEERPSLYRVFAILVGIDRVKDIHKFIQYGINDSVLPLIMAKEKRELADIRLHSMGDPHMDNDKLQRCFEDYSQKDLGLFKMYQNLINIPFFLFPGDDSTVLFYELDPSCVLPIIDVGEPKRGGSGSVKRIEIHHAHHNYDSVGRDHSNIHFAVKTLHFHNDKGYQKEVEALERLSMKRKDKSPDHLVPLELAYRHGDKCCLVFPWASGNLKEYWKTHQKSPDNHEHVVWLFKQCRGLALGLRRLHSPRSYAISAMENTNTPTKEYDPDDKYGRHGDIKPDNILWFNNYNGDPDHLAICDFGSTEFNTFESKSHVKADQVNGYSKTYQPPDRHAGGEISQRFDIWSLGCVFLEFISWFLFGHDQVFPQQRMMVDPKISKVIVKEDQFFYFVHSRRRGGEKIAKVKPAVLDSCPESIHEFLDLVQFQMLQPMSRERSDSMSVRLQLQEMYNKCCKDQTYATAGYAKTTKQPKGILYFLTRLDVPSLFKSRSPADQEEINDLEPDKLRHQPHNHMIPKVIDEMFIPAPPLEEFEKDIGDLSEVTNGRRNSLSIEDKTHNQEFVPPRMPTHFNNGGTGSSNGLLQMITGDTTPCYTETGDADVNLGNPVSNHSQDDTTGNLWENCDIENFSSRRQNTGDDIIRKNRSFGKKTSNSILWNPAESREGNKPPQNEFLLTAAASETTTQRTTINRRTAFSGQATRIREKTRGVLGRLSLQLRIPQGRSRN